MTEVPVPEPRATYELAGHEAAERAFLDAMRRGRVHHAWLLVGPRGVGKATFAYRAARRLMGAAPAPELGLLGARPDDPVCRRIEEDAHHDLTVVTRPWDEKNERFKGEITVGEARKLAEAFSLTAVENPWKVGIIDAADDMNPNAANAILKTLEEPPPHTVVFLVCHAPGRLLTTVRSRCRRLAFRTPGEAAARDVVMKLVGCDAAAAAASARIARGRPGEAVRLAAAGGAELAAGLERLLQGLPRLDPEQAHALAEKLGGRDVESQRAYFFEALASHALARAREGGSAEAWGDVWDRVGSLAREMEVLNLDPRLVVLEALASARDAAKA